MNSTEIFLAILGIVVLLSQLSQVLDSEHGGQKKQLPNWPKNKNLELLAEISETPLLNSG